MKQIFASFLIGMALAASPMTSAQADTASTPLARAVERVEAEGYVVVDSYRSWLGRLVIVSARDGVLRELVLNRATGAILSDRLFRAPQGQDSSQNQPPNGATSGGASHGAASPHSTDSTGNRN